MTGDFLNVADLAVAVIDMPAVLHFIGSTIPQSSMNDIHYDIETNVLPTVNLLELMRNNPGQRLIFASSGGTVYGIAHQNRPLVETDANEPISSYGVSKLMIEKYIRLFGHNFGLPYTILRFANPYGESQYVGRPQGAVSVFLHKALRGEEIVIWGDGSVVRDYVYEADIASVVPKILDSDCTNGVYNVGSGKGTTLNELIQHIFENTGITCHVTYDNFRKFDVPYNVLDATKIYQDTGWVSSYTLSDGLKNMLQYQKVI
jgi:UDP-glucose 4-epimerase